MELYIGYIKLKFQLFLFYILIEKFVKLSSGLDKKLVIIKILYLEKMVEIISSVRYGIQ